MKSTKQIQANKLEFIKRSFPNLYKFILAIANYDWTHVDEFINARELSDFQNLEKLNNLLGTKLYRPLVMLMQSKTAAMSLQGLSNLLLDCKEFNNFFLTHHLKYPRVFNLWLKIHLHEPDKENAFAGRRKFFLQMCSDIDSKAAAKFLNTVLRDPAMYNLMMEGDIRVFQNLYEIYKTDRALYRRILELPFAKDQQKNRTLVLLETLQKSMPETESFQLDQLIERAYKFPDDKKPYDPANANIDQKKECMEHYIADLEDYISEMTTLTIDRSKRGKTAKETQQEKHILKNMVKVNAAKKLLEMLSPKEENNKKAPVTFNASEGDELISGKLLQIQLKNLSEIEVLKRYVTIRKHQPVKFFNHIIYTEAVKLEAAKKRINELQGKQVNYSFFEKRALKQGRLGEIEKSYMHPKK